MAPTIPPTVLLTRPREASERFAADLQAPIIVSPLMETVWLSPPAPEQVPDAFVFTSTRGVEGFVRLHALRGPAYCVGDRTAEVAQAAGFDAKSASGGVDELAAMLRAEAAGLRLLHVRGREVAGNLSDLVDPYIVYAQEPRDLNAAAHASLMADGVLVVPLFSPNSAERFGAALPGGVKAQLRIVAMSENVAREAERAGLQVLSTAEAPTGAAMAQAVRAALA